MSKYSILLHFNDQRWILLVIFRVFHGTDCIGTGYNIDEKKGRGHANYYFHELADIGIVLDPGINSQYRHNWNYNY